MDALGNDDNASIPEQVNRLNPWRKMMMMMMVMMIKEEYIGHILCRNCLLKHVTEGKIEERIELTGRRGRRRRQLLDNLEERRECWKLKEEALDRTRRRTRFGQGCGPVVRETNP